MHLAQFVRQALDSALVRVSGFSEKHDCSSVLLYPQDSVFLFSHYYCKAFGFLFGFGGAQLLCGVDETSTMWIPPPLIPQLSKTSLTSNATFSAWVQPYAYNELGPVCIGRSQRG